MKKTWILVANRTGARLFEHKGDHLERAETFDHPRGRLKDSELLTDKPGKTFERNSTEHHDYSPSQMPHEHEAETFARDLATTLDKMRREHTVRRIVLVAEPRFLGILRGCLNRDTAELVGDSVSKDLVNVEDRDLPKHLEGAVRLFPSSD